MKRLSIFFLFLLALTELLSEELDGEGIKSRAEAGNDQSQVVLARSAFQGNTLAQMIVGKMYFTGQGVKHDKVVD